MSFTRRHIIRFLLMLLILGCAFTTQQMVLGSDLTMQQTAQILVNDLDFGSRVQDRAIAYGDAIIPILRKESQDFGDLNNRNSFWIAEVLGNIKSRQSRATLYNLYSRKDSMKKLTGAVGLAHQGIFPDGISEKSFLVKSVRKCIATPLAIAMDTGYDPSEAELAVIALGYSRSTKALPCLIDLLGTHDMDYGCHTQACIAVARIRSPKVIPVLRDCLKSNDFHALPEAFRALVTLGDREAIPLSINRITPEIKHYNSGFVVKELTKVTGQRYDYDRQKWMDWWNSAKQNWIIPKEFTRDWDKQEHDY